MINLSSLSALLRSIRPVNPGDAASPPVMRVAAVPPVAADDAGAMMSPALRGGAWLPPTTLTDDAGAEPPRDLARAPRAAAQGADPSPGTARATSTIAAHPASTELDLTAAARVLQAALRSAGLRAPAPATIESPAPLANASGVSAPHLAGALQQAIAASGLFYESHLARVLQRDYPLAALAREPQAGWPANTLAPDASTVTSAQTQEASSMVTRQLDVLDTRALVWTGELWPGQRATIALREEVDPEAANDPDDRPTASTWRTRVSLNLPSLGLVHASLSVRDRAVDFALVAANDDARSRLDTAKPVLTEALASANVVAGRIDIGQGTEG